VLLTARISSSGGVTAVEWACNGGAYTRFPSANYNYNFVVPAGVYSCQARGLVGASSVACSPAIVSFQSSCPSGLSPTARGYCECRYFVNPPPWTIGSTITLTTLHDSAASAEARWQCNGSTTPTLFSTNTGYNIVVPGPPTTYTGCYVEARVHDSWAGAGVSSDSFIRCNPQTLDAQVRCPAANPTWNPAQTTCGKCAVPPGWSGTCGGVPYGAGAFAPVGVCESVTGPAPEYYTGPATCLADGAFTAP
jgi:hypothetical protein